MSAWCVRLFFTDRVHFGKLGVGLESVEEILHADSLYSALCHAWSARFGATAIVSMPRSAAIPKTARVSSTSCASRAASPTSCAE